MRVVGAGFGAATGEACDEMGVFEDSFPYKSCLLSTNNVVGPASLQLDSLPSQSQDIYSELCEGCSRP